MLGQALAMTFDQFLTSLGLVIGLFFLASFTAIVGMEIGRKLSARHRARWEAQVEADRERAIEATKPYAAIGGVDRDFHRRAG